MGERGVGGIVASLLGLAFLAEVALLAGLAWAGWSMTEATLSSWVLAILLPTAAAVVWGTWCSPKAPQRLPTLYRWGVKMTLFAAALVLLLGFGPMPEAGIFAVLMWLAFLVSLPADRALGAR